MRFSDCQSASFATADRRSLRPALWLAALLLLLATALPGAETARAQDATTPASRPCLDNVCGGFELQPSESEIQNLERKDGIAPSRQQDQQENAEVDKLYKELENANPDGNLKAAPK